MSVQTIGTEVTRGTNDDAEYDAFLARVNARFLANTRNGSEPVFTTDVQGLFTAYLDAMPESARQHHACNACRQFVERFGSLVTISEAGETAPAIWNEDDAPEFYKDAVRAMAREVRRGKVTGVFLAKEPVWGHPQTGMWRHLFVKPIFVFKHALLTPGQMMAEKREDFKNVMHALNEFTQPMIEQALTLLETDSLYRSEKVIGPAKWLHGLHVARAAANGTARANVVWRGIATAPAGFAHPRSSMIGTLLEDIAAGKEFSEVSRSFAAKMHPLQYQRPQAAPSAGAIAAAEKVVTQLGASGSLARRFCRPDEVQAIWIPAPFKDAPTAVGVFGHLTPKGTAPLPDMKVPPVTMTWDKFSRTVLPTAESIEFYARSVRESYGVLVTAVNADAPPILQWDREDKRNPVSWYVWHGGSTPGEFGLVGNTYHKVSAVTLKPSAWGLEPGATDHHGEAVMFLIEGAKETKNAGAAIFPETLKAEFHGIRAVIEAYSRAAEIDGLHTPPHACGPLLAKGGSWNALFRVKSGGRTVDYKLDRWD